MKYVKTLAMLLALGLFATGCKDAAEDARDVTGDTQVATGTQGDAVTTPGGNVGRGVGGSTTEGRAAAGALGGAVEYTEKAIRDAGSASLNAASWQQTWGDVTYQGKPVSRAEVVFYRKSSPFNRIAHTDGEGRFVCKTHRGKGLPAGEYQIVVRPIFVDPVLNGNGDPNNPVPPMTRQDIPRKYQQQKTSTLWFTVVEGDNEMNLVLDGNK